MMSRMFWLGLLMVVAVDANKWVMTVETDSQWMAGYVGDVAVCFTYRPSVAISDDDLSNNDTTATAPSLKVQDECQSLPNKRFVRGKTYMFELEFHDVVDVLEQVRLFGKPSGTSVCKRKANMDTWHVKELSFHDMLTGRLFQVRKRNDRPLLIETRCSEGNELLLDKFNVSVKPRPCSIDGVIYRSGDPFDDGCSARCKCNDGGFSCVSMCPPFISPGCRHIYNPGHCCQTHICENSPNFPKRCPMYEEGDCEMANRTVDVGDFPWTVFIKLCDKKGCRKFCSGALINERYVLTAGECLRSVANISRDVRVIVGENTIVLSEDLEVEMTVENVTFSNAKQNSEQLALIKLSDPVVFDQTVQPATLPVSREQCQMLTRPRCATTMTGWVNVGVESEQYELYQLSVKLLDGAECDPPSNSSSVLGGRKRKPPPPSSSARGMCIDLSNDEVPTNAECGNCQPDINSNGSVAGCPSDKNWYLCTGERGRVVSTKLPVPSGGGDTLEVNYVVGVVAYQLATGDTPTDVCKKPAYKLAVNICNELDWISDTAKNYYY